ncbi:MULTISPECIES: glycosyltransferase family 4 protein [unclassified Flavobacterium]|uniref:glycosyltransferase family 4 protein n=1 Tax=unclassified Flavobacterium TaxID=196869 RepID=UPI000EB3384E|nr:MULTISPECIES: glycosyltransferase family 4 protein [unclassified Flavobacterium]RKS01920.1 glycosyltransferase involved in cell wall biosynthesis [Flavobacterium sp. 102]
MSSLLYIGNKLSNHGFTSTSIETLGSFLEAEGYTVYYASSKRNKFFRMLEMIGMTFKYAKKVDYVLIDTYSTINFWYAFFISQLCRVLGVKYIPKLHGGDLPSRIVRTRFFSNLIFKNAFVNIAPSYYLYEAFKKNGYTNLKYIPNTIELQIYPQSLKEFKVPKLLWVRSFAKIYNPLMAVKVFINIKKIYPDAQLCMIGPKKDDSYEKTVRFAQKNNVEVTFTGKLSKEAWIEVSKEYNIFINTTHFDNTPISVIEAMALGLPVVSTDVGGIPFLLEHDVNALLVSDNDTKGMTLQIDRLITDSNLAVNISKKAKDTVTEFDWEVVKKQWIDLLK